MKTLAGSLVGELFDLVVEAAPNAMALVDPDGRIVLVNALTVGVFGYAREELLGRRVEMLVPGLFRAAHPDKREGFFTSPQAHSAGAACSLYGLRKDGTEVPIEIRLNPISTTDGVFVLAGILDLTERRRAEEATRNLAAIVESSDDAII